MLHLRYSSHIPGEMVKGPQCKSPTFRVEVWAGNRLTGVTACWWHVMLGAWARRLRKETGTDPRPPAL